MPLAAKRKTDLIIGRGLISAETVASELRARLVRRLSAERSSMISEMQLLNLARNILAEFEPLLAQNLFDSEIASWVTGIDYVAGLLPAPVESAIVASNGGIGGRPPFDIGTLFYPPDEPDPVVRFPLVEEAAQSLANRRLLTREEFDALAREVKYQAFTVASVDSQETLAKIRDALQQSIEEGPSLRVFKEKLAETLEASPIGPAHLETVYRTNIQTAFAVGRDNLAQNPVVASVFQYQEYLAIHDGRVDPQHLALESLGLNGTGVYRADDPFWDVFTPPWRYNCRCGVNLLTIEAAARKGVREAQEWMRTGEPPANPEWRLDYIPFRPDPGWGTRPRLRAA